MSFDNEHYEYYKARLSDMLQTAERHRLIANIDRCWNRPHGAAAVFTDIKNFFIKLLCLPDKQSVACQSCCS